MTRDRAWFLQRGTDALAAHEIDASQATLHWSPDSNTGTLLTDTHVFRAGNAWPIDADGERRIWAAARANNVPAPEAVATGAIDGEPFQIYVRLVGAARTDVAADALARVLTGVHACPIEAFPAELASRPRRRARFAIAREGIPALCSAADRATVDDLVARAEDDWLAARDVPCHGDARAANLLTGGGDIVGVIDWSDARRASAESDLGSTDPERVPELIAAYRKVAARPIDAQLVVGHALARQCALAEIGVIPADRAQRQLDALLACAAAADHHPTQLAESAS